jgi:hypothetical protein
MPGVFISYRRGDALGHAGRLYDRLATFFHEDYLFMDLERMPPGVDFVREIEERVGSCDVLLAIIGPDWLTIKDDNGNVRLEDPQDFMRLEVKIGLARDDVVVIPVLVGGARMPTAAQLPEGLKALSRRHALDISASRWEFDTQRLVDAIRDHTRGRIPAPPSGSASPPDEPPTPGPVERRPRRRIEIEPEPMPARQPVAVGDKPPTLPPIAPKSPTVVAPSTPEVTAPPPPEDRSKPFRTWGWILGTIGAIVVPLLAIVAIVFGCLVISRSDGRRTGTGVAIIVVSIFAGFFGLGIWASA